MNPPPKFRYKEILPQIIVIVAACACSNIETQPTSLTTTQPKQNPGKINSWTLAVKKQPLPTKVANPTELQTNIIPILTPTQKLIPTKSQATLPTQTSDVTFVPGFDLYYIHDGMLNIWESENGEITSVTYRRGSGKNIYAKSIALDSIANITEYVVDSNNEEIYIQISKGIAANGIELYDLGLIDLEEEKLTTFITNTSRLYNLSLSPDGSWLSFRSEQDGSGPLFAVNTEVTRNFFMIGDCVVATGKACDKVVWSPNSDAALWSDERGLWLSTVSEFLPRKIIGTQIDVSSLSGETEVLDVHLSNLRWSPKGRYVIATAQPSRSEVRWEALIDTMRRRVVEIPGTYNYNNLPAVIKWIADGHLLSVQFSKNGTSMHMKFDLFGLFPTNESILMKEKEIIVDVSHLEFSTSSYGDKFEPSSFKLNIMDDRNIMIILNNDEVTIPPIVIGVDLKYGSVAKIFDLPTGTNDLLWAPDGNRIILVDTPQRVYYLDYQKKIIFDLNALLGENLCCFSWKTH